MTSCERTGQSLACLPAARVSAMKKRYPLAAAVYASVVFVLFVAPAQAAVGPWISDGKARIRLLAAGIDASGQLRGGVEIALDPGWHTYWRSPGDSGIAP